MDSPTMGTDEAACKQRQIIEELIRQWRRERAPELANLIEQSCAQTPFPKGDPLALESQLAEVTKSTASDASVRAHALTKRPPDPRIGTAALQWLIEAPFRSAQSRPFWNAVFTLLIANADRRALQRLPDAGEAVQCRVGGKTMRNWLVGQIERASRTIELQLKSLPATSRKQVEDAAAALAVAESYTSTPWSSFGSRDVEFELLKSVFAKPEDDSPRAVYADMLTEQLDPRGEFITLQLADARGELSEKAKRRMRGLLRKNERLWLGELAPLLTQTRFARGFLVECAPAGARKLAALVGRPELGTVESVKLWDRNWKKSLELLTHPVMRALESVEIVELPAPFPPPLVDRLKRLHINDRRGRTPLKDVLGACTTLPRLRNLIIEYWGDVPGHPPPFDSLPALLALPNLSTLRLHVVNDTGVEVSFNRGSGEIILTTEGSAEGAVRLLRAIPERGVQQVEIRGETFTRGIGETSVRVTKSITTQARDELSKLVADRFASASLVLCAPIGQARQERDRD